MSRHTPNPITATIVFTVVFAIVMIAHYHIYRKPLLKTYHIRLDDRGYECEKIDEDKYGRITLNCALE